MALHIVNDQAGLNHKERFPLSHKDYQRSVIASQHDWVRLPDKPNDNKQYWRCERCSMEAFNFKDDKVYYVDDMLNLESCDERVAKSILVS